MSVKYSFYNFDEQTKPLFFTPIYIYSSRYLPIPKLLLNYNPNYNLRPTDFQRGIYQDKKVNVRNTKRRILLIRDFFF